jgi:hypothetical protein
MSVGLFLTVTLSFTAGPNPQPSNAAVAGHATNTATGTSTSPVDVVNGISTAGLVVALVTTGLVIYIASLMLHPNAKCGRCKGAGRHKGALFSYATRLCTSCKGRGTHPRIGRRLLFRQPS